MNIIKFQTKITTHEKILIDDSIKISNFSLCDFLSNQFSIDITDDPDIVSGFERDWSNIPGHADYLARPINEHQCALILYICDLLSIHITISAGKTNLTGSATPNGGIILSTSLLTTPNISIDIKKKELNRKFKDLKRKFYNRNIFKYVCDITSEKQKETERDKINILNRFFIFFVLVFSTQP